MKYNSYISTKHVDYEIDRVYRTFFHRGILRTTFKGGSPGTRSSVCTKCEGKAYYWNKVSNSWICKHCHHQTILTSGTVMHGSNLPLRYWFIAIHLLTATKKTIFAKEMRSYQNESNRKPQIHNNFFTI